MIGEKLSHAGRMFNRVIDECAIQEVKNGAAKGSLPIKKRAPNPQWLST